MGILLRIGIERIGLSTLSRDLRAPISFCYCLHGTSTEKCHLWSVSAERIQPNAENQGILENGFDHVQLRRGLLTGAHYTLARVLESEL